MLDKMKPGVMLINTARSPVINTDKVIEALANGKIGYLGLNVYEKEKGIFFYDHSKRKIKDDMLIKLMSYPVPVFPIVTLVLFQLVSAAQLIFI